MRSNFFEDFKKCFIKGLDPFDIYPKMMKTGQKTVDTGDNILNKGLDTANNTVDSLDNLVKMMTKFLPVILIGGVVTKF